MELTKKDYIVLEFITKYKYVKLNHIKAFIKISNIPKSLQRLVWQKLIKIENDIIQNINDKSLTSDEILYKKNIIKILDVVTQLKNENRIKNIDTINQPYYIMARSMKKEAYMYFTIINKGNEMIQLALLDRENCSNTILILEDKTQVESLKILKTKVNKVIIYEDYIITNKI